MPTLKHGAHSINLNLNGGAIVTTAADAWPYDMASWSNFNNLDPTTEKVLLGSLTASTGTYANWTVLTLTHYNSAGTIVDQINLVGLAPTAHVAVDITNRAAAVGNTLSQGWTLANGDTIELLGTAGTAGPGVGVDLIVGVPS